MRVEFVKTSIPNLPIVVHPRVQRAKRFRPERVESALGVLSDAHKSRFVQQAQLFRDAGLVDADFVHEFANGAFARAESLNQAPTSWVGEDFEGIHNAKYRPNGIFLSGNIHPILRLNSNA